MRRERMMYRWEHLTKLYYIIWHIFLFCHWYFVFCPTLSQVLLHWMIMLKPCIQSAHRTWRIRTFIIRLLISSSLTKRTHLWHLLLCIHPQMMLCLCEVQLTLSLDIKKTTDQFNCCRLLPYCNKLLLLSNVYWCHLYSVKHNFTEIKQKYGTFCKVSE